MPDLAVSQPEKPDYFPLSIRKKHNVKYENYRPDTSPSVPPVYVDWEPDLSRAAKGLEGGPATRRKPPNELPSAINGPLAWSADDIRNEEIIFELTEDHQVEIRKAVAEVQSERPPFTCTIGVKGVH